jgi:hypothetical protein
MLTRLSIKGNEKAKGKSKKAKGTGSFNSQKEMAKAETKHVKTRFVGFASLATSRKRLAYLPSDAR